MNRCAKCSKSFVNGDTKSKYNNLEYHQRCFVCNTCDQIIKHSFYALSDNEYRCNDCQQRLAEIITCSACNEQIDGSYVQYRNKTLHATCFCCEACQEQLSNVLYVENNEKPYCVSCHIERFAKLCAICQRPFASGTQSRIFNDRSYHIGCFRCFRCGKIIFGHDYKINSEQQRICQACVETQ
ncbi:unnamed protein product [Didymodactylos carnosus]|uniref:LIM zinc-binding domain-containing protein n=1 Tax=Didymodactylos carnosus TaxID=1234261 RepID=A0A815JQ80_9BILA|nr:unnamed protein product [Didymodactylos carnosus]CAF1379671.1 unnamed protein product [Didymodactylos carnosus]CAF3601441.1 unnamed protein product [Didymodactylos carnosus]CAF4273352.1 unnamed protein product [Didymodactylos carnosus]